MLSILLIMVCIHLVVKFSNKLETASNRESRGWNTIVDTLSNTDNSEILPRSGGMDLTTIRTMYTCSSLDDSRQWTDSYALLFSKVTTDLQSIELKLWQVVLCASVIAFDFLRLLARRGERECWRLWWRIEECLFFRFFDDDDDDWNSILISKKTTIMSNLHIIHNSMNIKK